MMSERVSRVGERQWLESKHWLFRNYRRSNLNKQTNKKRNETKRDESTKKKKKRLDTRKKNEPKMH
jgi:hypothetical protein